MDSIVPPPPPPRRPMIKPPPLFSDDEEDNDKEENCQTVISNDQYGESHDGVPPGAAVFSMFEQLEQAAAVEAAVEAARQPSLICARQMFHAWYMDEDDEDEDDELAINDPFDLTDKGSSNALLKKTKKKKKKDKQKKTRRSSFGGNVGDEYEYGSTTTNFAAAGESAHNQRKGKGRFHRRLSLTGRR